MTFPNDEERRKYFLEKLRATRPLVSAAKEARLKGSLKRHNDLALFCVPPTRLAGPCRMVLTQMLKNNFGYENHLNQGGHQWQTKKQT